MCTTCIPKETSRGCQISDYLKLELWMVEKHHVGVGNGT